MIGCVTRITIGNQDMSAISKLYDALINGLAVSGIIAIAVMTCLILADVTMRYAGLGSVQSASTLIEYSLLYSTMAGAPWLVRKRGHITVTSLTDLLPEKGSRFVGLVTLTISILTLLVLGWRACVVALEKWQQNSMDVRSIAVPEWIAYAILACGFLLMASESIRLILRGEIKAAGSAAT